VLTLYSMQSSGNSYKARMLLARLGRDYHLVEIDRFKGENRTPEYLSKNPEGRLPALELDDGRILAESNAILVYLAEGTQWLPADRFEYAETLRWMFFEQHSHEPAIAEARFWLRFVRGGRELRTHEIDQWMERGYAALALMEQHLSRHDYFVGNRETVADLALFAHTHVAPEGEFDLSGFPSVGRWIARIAGNPGHISIDDVHSSVSFGLSPARGPATV
jgi:glutathione S-transferase